MSNIIENIEQAETTIKVLAHLPKIDPAYKILEENLEPLVGQRVVTRNGRHYVNGGYWQEITRGGMVNRYGVTEKWSELLVDDEEGEKWDALN